MPIEPFANSNLGYIQLSSASWGYFGEIPLSYPYVLAFLTFPVCALKNWINVIQMINAAKALAEVDKEERRREGLGGAGKQS
jgi:CDP-diacylglycerol--inositol 3-phosphatidyltransferase